MSSTLPLLIVFLIALLTKNNLLAAAAATVFFMDLMRLHRFFPLIQSRGLETGVLFLTIALLVPLANGDITMKNLASALLTPIGILAVIGGIVGAYLNSQGLDLLTVEPSIIPGILIGIMVSVFFFDGVSVGPIMAAGITALLVRLFLR